jgi:hypothetical protein
MREELDRLRKRLRAEQVALLFASQLLSGPPTAFVAAAPMATRRGPRRNGAPAAASAAAWTFGLLWIAIG